ncbi:squalene--hopene cyclase [Halobacillus halophilus]|nr:squalene--hopene cyclase [Halobacillus halophilus]
MRLVNLLKEQQTMDGSWNYPFETGIITDAYMIILLRTLNFHEGELVQQLTARILSRQERNGSWKLFYDEESGNLSSTIEAYYALLFSGLCKKEDIELKKARNFIQNHGGLEKASMFTKILLSLTGQYHWPEKFTIPVEVILLPPAFPIQLFDISVFGRSNLVPILLLAHKKYQAGSIHTPDLSELSTSHKNRSGEDSFFEDDIRSLEWKKYFRELLNVMSQNLNYLVNLEEAAIRKAENYMINRIEPDGTLLSYFSSTFYMIFSFLALGYKKEDPVIENAVEGLKSMACKINGQIHMQYTTADVWNTALISSAMQEAGVPGNALVIQKANDYLLSRQHVKYGDWVLHNTKTLPGGWGFSNINTINPDVDDSTAALRSIKSQVSFNVDYRQAWDRGVNWVFSMQNDDGGWPAFEREVNQPFLEYLPIQGSSFILSDASSADLTGRTLEFFGRHTHTPYDHPAIKKGQKWLKKHQNKNGSWYGRWGICYIYGTWAALTGLIASGKDPQSPVVKKSVRWLENIQNQDGGWGESCSSDKKKRYVPLGSSTLTHTAWALDGLIAASSEPSEEMVKGVQFLINRGKGEGWTYEYPKGQGMAGAFYIHYHSYRYVWPLLTLSHYHQKFLT